MRKHKAFAFLFLLVVLVSSGYVQAGPPLTNLEGVGGIAFNPLAYPADSQGKDSHAKLGGSEFIGSPRIGAWYVDLHEKSIDWTAWGVADSLFKRIELSYGYEAVAVGGVANFRKSNVGAKALLIPENAGGSKVVPAIAAGVVYKTVSAVAGNVKYSISDLFGPDVKGEDADYYAVATKLIGQSPWPVLLSAGALSTRGHATGVLGFDKDRKTVGFGNIDVILPVHVALGFEYQQGAQFEIHKNPDYWDAHLAWIPTANLTVVLAYVNAGDTTKTDQVGLGEGSVLSLQHTF